MSVFDLIPVLQEPMSVYTLCGFVLYSGLLTILSRFGCQRMNELDKDANETMKTINRMHVDMAVMAESLKNIEEDGTQTRTTIAEINRTLLDKLT